MTSIQDLTPEQIRALDDYMAWRYPEFFEITRAITEMEFGDLEINLKIRSGVVNQMEITQTRQWRREKLK